MPLLTRLPPVEQLSPTIIRVLGHNANEFTLQGTNTYIIGSGTERILIDAGDANNEQYIACLKSTLGDAVITAIIITHCHADHIGGVDDVTQKIIGKKVPIYKLRRTIEADDPAGLTYVEDGHVVSVPGSTIKFIATPGHTSDHAALWYEEENSLFSGDCILGEGTSVFEDLQIYLESLHKLLQYKPNLLYPGHGPVVEDSRHRIKEYISHRHKREMEILDHMKDGEPITSTELTNRMYGDAPITIILAALRNVRLHLGKLKKEGRIQMLSTERYQIVPQSNN